MGPGKHSPTTLSLFFQLQMYDLQIEHKPRRDLVVADTLSTAFEKSAVAQSPELDFVHVNRIKTNLSDLRTNLDDDWQRNSSG